MVWCDSRHCENPCPEPSPLSRALFFAGAGPTPPDTLRPFGHCAASRPPGRSQRRKKSSLADGKFHLVQHLSPKRPPIPIAILWEKFSILVRQR
ncbi:hypothetical protein LZ30DRAFT_380245 [Colletotrichum cereale]|nr:hypothetical protein LZ30DRAFT_380245 [Colletotrichum cereale]